MISLEVTLAKKKDWKNRKSDEKEKGEEEKPVVELLVFMLATFLNQKLTLLDKRGVFGGNVFINPALYIRAVFVACENIRFSLLFVAGDVK